MFYFRCLDGIWTSGSSVSIKVETGVAIYTKTVSLPKDYVFADGGLTKFGFQGMTKKDYKAEASAKHDIHRSTSKAEIDAAIESANRTIQVQISNVTAEHYRQLDEAKASASAEVQAKAEAAKAEIDRFDVSDQDKAKGEIDNAVYIAVEAIDNSTTIAAVNMTRDNTIAKINEEVEKIRPTS